MSLDLNAIRERAEAATPGPWYWRGNTDTDDPRLVGGPGRHTVLVVMRRERQVDDRETKGFERYLRECDVSYVDADGKTAYRPYTDEEIADQVETEWLHDPWGGPAYDLRLAFRDMGTNIMGYARDMAVYEVCPDAVSRDDERVYRADVVGVRHPDAVFMEHAREDVPALLAEIERLRQHILDIDAHATPYGDIPDDPGYVGVYLLTAGALHRALGRIGHTAPKCEAEAEVERLRAECVQMDAANTGLGRALAEARAELARHAERLDQADQLVAQYAPIAVPILADIQARKERAARMAAHTHYCWTCSEGDKPGDGCHNCRNTGMDQTPCVGCPGPQLAAEPSGEADLDPNAPPIEAVLHALGDVIASDEPTGRTRCPLCKTLPIGHEGDCEP